MRDLLGLLLSFFLLASGTRATPLFEVLASTRQITALAATGDTVQIGTSGGLVLMTYQGPQRGELLHLLPGTKIWSISHDLTSPEATLLATQKGLYRCFRRGIQKASELPTTAVLAVPSREMLLTGHPNGVVRWLKKGGQQRISRLPTRSPVFHLAVHQGGLFAGNSEGLWSLDKDGNIRSEVLSPDVLTRTVTWIGNHENRLLVGTPGGLFQRQNKGWRRLGGVVHVLGGGTSKEQLLIGTMGDGCWSLEGDVLEPYSHELERATAFLEISGGLLVGTAGNGVLHLDPARHRSTGGGLSAFYQETNEPPENNFTSLTWVEDQKTLYAGTFEHGVAVFRGDRWTTQTLANGLPSLWINHLASEGQRVLARVSDGRVVQSWRGSRWTSLGKEQGWPKNWSSSLGNDQKNLWVGSQSAFYLANPPGHWKVFRPKPALDQRLVLDVARFEGRTFVATHRAGLISLDPETGSWEQFSLGSGLSDSWVSSLEVFGGALWAGTFQGGLCRLRSLDHPWEIIKQDDPVARLPSNGITTLLATERELWVGTLEGLVRTEGESWRHFSLADGLSNSNITALTASRDHLWVGSPAGLSRASLTRLREPVSNGLDPVSAQPQKPGQPQE